MWDDGQSRQRLRLQVLWADYGSAMPLPGYGTTAVALISLSYSVAPASRGHCCHVTIALVFLPEDFGEGEVASSSSSG